MIIACISLDASNTGKKDVSALLSGGQILHAAGWLNARWDDFSAFDLAQAAELSEVEWEMLTDDTPGTLILTICYPLLTEAQIKPRLSEVNGVESYALENALYDLNDILQRE